MIKNCRNWIGGVFEGCAPSKEDMSKLNAFFKGVHGRRRSRLVTVAQTVADILRVAMSEVPWTKLIDLQGGGVSDSYPSQALSQVVFGLSTRIDSRIYFYLYSDLIECTSRYVGNPCMLLDRREYRLRDIGYIFNEILCDGARAQGVESSDHMRNLAELFNADPVSLFVDNYIESPCLDAKCNRDCITQPNQENIPFQPQDTTESTPQAECVTSGSDAIIAMEYGITSSSSHDTQNAG